MVMPAMSASFMWAIRHRFNQAIRSFFDERSYLEVETPILVCQPGTEVYLEYFQTSWLDHARRSHELYLRSSPELHMKQILSQGPKRIFQIAKSFRNHGELSHWHHPEFSMLEWYRAEDDFEGLIQETIDLIACVHSRLKAAYPEHVASLDVKSWKFFSVKQAFADFAGIDLIDKDPLLWKKARTAGVISVNEKEDFESAFFKVLIEKIEPVFQSFEGVVFYDYPPSQAALARVVDGAAKRFEIYFHGVELCNGFYELTDYSENIKRMKESNSARLERGANPVPLDDFFIAALSHGLPTSCGNALGLDRLLALLLGKQALDACLPLSRQAPFGDICHY